MELQERLRNLAFKKTIPFCYGCYKEATTGRCNSCGSDDLMRLLPGNGVEWGHDWVVKNLIEENLSPINVGDEFEESVRSCYPETVTVGWMELDAVTVMKEVDPVSWDLAQSEWVSNEEGDGLMMTFDGGSTYYRTSEVEEYVDSELPTEEVG